MVEDRMKASEKTHIQRARRRLEERAQERAEELEAKRLEAARDSQAIARMIAREYEPRRIYQWGSVLRPGGFREYSDVDIAVEGVTDAGAFFKMLAAAGKMTSFPLDLVQMEKIEPEYAEEIRRYGEVIHEKH